MFEAEQAAEVVRAAANTDINTIFGSVINENLSDEVIVTVIATGFDKNKKAAQASPAQEQPVFSNTQQTRRSTPSKEDFRPTEVLQDSDDSDDGDFDIPAFLRDRNY